MASVPDKGKLQGEFNAEQGSAPKLLYHAIPVAAQGEAIRASIKYGMDIRPEILSELGVTDTDHPPLVFASNYLTKALAFGLDGFKGEKLFNMGIDGTNDELVVTASRETTMSRVRDGKVYAFPAENFVNLPYADRQSVSTTPVKFNEAQVVLEIKSADDLMRAGLQIFSFKESVGELHADKPLQELLGSGTYNALRQLIDEGRVVWENHARGINPNLVLAERLGINSSSRNPKPVANAP